MRLACLGVADRVVDAKKGQINVRLLLWGQGAIATMRVRVKGLKGSVLINRVSIRSLQSELCSD